MQRKNKFRQPHPPPDEKPPALPKPPPGTARSLTPKPSVEISNGINKFTPCCLYIFKLSFFESLAEFPPPLFPGNQLFERQRQQRRMQKCSLIFEGFKSPGGKDRDERRKIKRPKEREQKDTYKNTGRHSFSIWTGCPFIFHWFSFIFLSFPCFPLVSLHFPHFLLVLHWFSLFPR